MQNRISYLGSVFLPMAMLMIILNVTNIKYRKWLSSLLLGIAIAVFLVAASPGYLDIYYKEVAFEIANGVSMLHKVYGPWHCIYLFYLLGYFAVTCGVVIYVAAKRKLGSAVHGAILAAAVFVNIGVWLIEQLVQIDFEILSISYIISEIFLLALHMVMQEYTRLKALIAQQPAAEDTPIPEATPAPCNCAQETPSIDYTQFDAGLLSLTKTERTIYEFYLAGKTTKEIMAELNIKENTLKFHNKNLYGKLGVSSRKQLLEIARAKSAEPL